MLKNFSFSGSDKPQQKEKKLFFRRLSGSNEPSSFDFRKALRILKLVIYGFSFVMIFWSFIQTLALPYTRASSEPGSGLEFGFFPNAKWGTGDHKYDVFSLEINALNYHAFFMPTVKYGPFLSLLVYPFAYLFLNLIYGLGKLHTTIEKTGLNVVFSIIIMLLFMRSFSFFATLRGAYYADQQLIHKPFIDRISRKYDDTDQSSKQRKQLEIREYNKKHGLKPFAQLENFFIITPIFLITYKIITTMRPLKFTTLFGVWQLSETPISMIFGHFADKDKMGWAYLLLCLVIMPINFLGQKLPMWLSKKRNPGADDASQNNPQMESYKKIQNILTIVFLMFCFIWSTGLAVYYFFNSLFTIGQSFLIHWILLKWRVKKNTLEDELEKFGIY